MGRVGILAFGLLAGLALGHALWGGRSLGTPGRSTPPPDADGASRHRPVETGPAAGPAPRSSAVDVFAAGTPAAIDQAMRGEAVPLAAGAVDVLLERLDAAVGAGETALFLALVKALGKSGDPRAHARLVELMDDLSAPLPGGAAYAFATALLESEAPGIREAARRRFEAGAEGPGWSASPWLQLVAAHGTEEDIDWLLGAPPEHRNAAVSYVACARNEAAAAAFGQLLRERPEDPDALRWLPAHGTPHPSACYALATEILGRRGPGSGPPDRSLLIAAGQTVPADRLPELRTLLERMSHSRDRFSGLLAVGAMHGRGLDITTFASIVDAPARLLESGADVAATMEARDAIEHHRVTWSERTARALERAADRFRGDAAQAPLVADLERLAKEVRARLASHWK